MFNIKKLRSIEARGMSDQPDPQRSAAIRVFWLFLIVVLGILASWFWEIGWAYLADTTKPFQLGPFPAIVVRVILSFIAAGVTFVTMYSKINQNTQESWIPFLLAFQNGFFWDAIFQGVAQAVSGGG